MEEIPFEASREGFRKTTRQLLMRSKSVDDGPRGISKALDPEKYDPSKHAPTRDTYRSIAERNPFEDDEEDPFSDSAEIRDEIRARASTNLFIDFNNLHSISTSTSATKHSTEGMAPRHHQYADQSRKKHASQNSESSRGAAQQQFSRPQALSDNHQHEEAGRHQPSNRPWLEGYPEEQVQPLYRSQSQQRDHHHAQRSRHAQQSGHIQNIERTQHMGPLHDIGRPHQVVRSRAAENSQQVDHQQISHAQQHGYAQPMGHSRSEGNIALHRQSPREGAHPVLMRSPLRPLPCSSIDGSASLFGESIVLDHKITHRGRSADRTPSPTKSTFHNRGRSLSPVKSTSSSALPSANKLQIEVAPPVPPKDLEQILEDDEDKEMGEEKLPKRSRSPMKQMFGPKGWLDRIPTDRAIKVELSRKQSLKNWGGKMRQRAGDMKGEVMKLIHESFQTSEKDMTTAPGGKVAAVLLDPPYQAKLYAEIELMISVTANKYLLDQKTFGRMSVESVEKIVKWWKSKGRPQVVDFQFDLMTQCNLVLANINTFRFYGPHAYEPIYMQAMIQCWKALAREMNPRIFCYPDLAIRKHMHDCYKILEMLGAPLPTFLAFQNIQLETLKRMTDEAQRREDHENTKWGIPVEFKPPIWVASGNPEDEDYEEGGDDNQAVTPFLEKKRVDRRPDDGTSG